MAELLELSDEHKKAILESYATPDDPESQKVIEAYEAQSKPKYTNDNILIPPKFKPIDPKMIEGVRPKSALMEGAKGAATGLGKVGAGVSVGAAELFNPFSLPGGIERLGRAAYKYTTTPKGFAESIQEADAEAFLPRGTLDQVAPYLRAGGTKAIEEGLDLFTGQERARPFAETLSEQQGRQAQFQEDRLVSAGQTAAELTGAVASIGMLARQFSQLPKVRQSLTKLKGLKVLDQAGGTDAGLTRAQLKKTRALQRQLLGDLPPELEKSLHENTQAVKALLEGPQEGRSVMSTVERVRQSLKANRDLLGETIGEFRHAIVSDNPVRFDTSRAVKELDDFVRSQRLSRGVSTLDPKDARAVQLFRQYLSASNRKGTVDFDTRDATVVVDKLDDYLKKQGYYDGENRTSVNRKLFGLRDAIDAEIAAMYPVYKEVKGRYSNFLNDYEQIQSRIEGLGAEGFVANLYGRNKTEVRELFERVLNNGKETKEAFQNAVLNADNISAKSQRYNDLVAAMRQKAATIQFEDGRQVMQEIADKAMARKLAEISDPAADKLADMIDTFVKQRADRVVGATTAGGTVAGTWLGMKLGNPSAGGMLGGGVGFGTGKMVESAMTPRWRSKAEYLFSVERLLDTLEKEKKVAQSTKDMARAVKWVWNTFGPEAGEAFLNKVHLTSQFERDLDGVFAAVGGVQGLQKGLEQKKRNFADDIREGR